MTTRIIQGLAIVLGITIFFFVVIALQLEDAVTRAMFMMISGLLVLWVAVGGTLMHTFRDPISARVRTIRLQWQVRFVMFATALALIEEAITTGMTNLAPVFGVEMGEAYITASANYLDVVLFHSVIVFIPMFIAWAHMLKRWGFTPGQVLLLFGTTGLLSEALTFGFQNLLQVPVWIFVYGLMVYLPAYTARQDYQAPPPQRIHYLYAVLLPIVYSVPVVLAVNLIHPVVIHF